MGGKRKPQIRKSKGKSAKWAKKKSGKGKVSKKKGVAKYPASKIALLPAGTQMYGLTMDKYIWVEL